MAELTVSRHGTPLGEMVAVARGGRLVLLEFSATGERVTRELRARFGEAYTLADGDRLGMAGRLERYFGARELAALDEVEVEYLGPEFHCEVWRELRRIPAGATRSYGELARALGKPGAARAVGYANSQNPIALVVPCHRVIGAGGALTGYAAGLERKHWLLVHEGAILI